MTSKERKRKKKHIFDYLLLVAPIKNGVTTKVSYDNQKCLLSLREHGWMCVHVCACVCVGVMSQRAIEHMSQLDGSWAPMRLTVSHTLCEGPKAEGLEVTDTKKS